MPRRLTELADVLRGAGLLVDETPVADWRDRSRSGNTSWYLDGRPTHIMVHHTASSIGSHDTIADEKREAAMLGLTHTVKPVCNLYRGPSGIWYPTAAGPTNTNGVGQDTWGGGTPDDSMNSYAISIECGNNGIGEAWTDLSGLIKGVAALARFYNIPTKCVRAHHEWSPGRKIDPASDGNKNKYTGSDRFGMFNMDIFRTDVAVARNPIPDNPGDDDYVMYLMRGPSGRMYATDRKGIAFYVPENEAEYFRDVKGYNVAADTGPWPIDAREERDCQIMAGEV